MHLQLFPSAAASPHSDNELLLLIVFDCNLMLGMRWWRMRVAVVYVGMFHNDVLYNYNINSYFKYN
jgi:hypothetical protein